MRDEWLAAVLRSAALHDRTKLVLIVLAGHMLDDGLVAVQREEVVAALGWTHVQRVSERCTDACAKGFLELVKHGGRGRPAKYKAALPSGQLGRKEPLSVRATRTATETMPSAPPRTESPFPSGIPGHLPKVTADSNHRGALAAAATSVLGTDESTPFSVDQSSGPVWQAVPTSVPYSCTTANLIPGGNS